MRRLKLCVVERGGLANAELQRVTDERDLGGQCPLMLGSSLCSATYFNQQGSSIRNRSL